MFRVEQLEDGEPTTRGTMTWVTGEGDSLVWVPDDSGVREDIHDMVDVCLPYESSDAKGETIAAGGRSWRVYNELPVTAPTIHMTVVSAQEPVRVAVASAMSFTEKKE